ncbi:MAG: hypothetical protein KAX49_15735 [Halanaerobiales bacterium]|nr:hypothetical protein [Halanaerobiales bacterium]
MSRKPQKFKPNENTNSINFTKKLNALVEAVNKANNISVNIKGGTGGISHYPNGHGININLPKKTISKGGGGGSTSTIDYFWGVIITSLSYDTSTTDGQCTYEIVKKDDYDTWVSAPSSVDTYTPKIINNYNIDETVITDDLREFVPWLEQGAVVPIMYFNLTSEDPSSGEDEIDYDNLFFLTSFNYTGNNQVKSISWNEDSGRIMSVYR